MFRRSPTLLAAAFVLAAATAALPALAQTSVPTQDFDVYVDLPTGFAFIKTPKGWKFIRKLDAEQMKKLHSTTLTSLLEPALDEGLGGVRYARPEPRSNTVVADGEG